MNINEFMINYENLKNSFEDMKIIVTNIPINKLSLENINALTKSLERFREESLEFVLALEDKEYMYDMFEGGSESKGFCRKLGIEESKLYEMKKTLQEIALFDLKKYLIEKKEN